jgi:hypothetical protein
MKPNSLKKGTTFIALVLAMTMVLPVFAQRRNERPPAPPERTAAGRRDSTNTLTLHFPVNQSAIQTNFSDNERTLNQLNRLLTNREFVASLDSVVINGYASPEGSATFNIRLAGERAQTVRTYIIQHFPQVSNGKIFTHSRLTDWRELAQLIAGDTSMPNRQEALTALSNPGLSDQQLLSRLQAIGNGAVYQYIRQHYAAALRQVITVLFYTRQPAQPPRPNPPAPPVRPEPQPAVQHRVDTVFIDNSEWIRKPLFALKTNLLFDLASALNVEVEVPLGKRWSVAGEYIFPWWLWERKQYCLETLSGNLEGRYWFGDRDRHRLLTGWFAGLYGSAGYYDLEWGKRGDQGEFFGGGLSVGYAHTINKRGNLRLEYSLGVGYLTTHYREYHPLYGPDYGLDDKWYLIREKNDRKNWIGPTRAKISLVWLLDYGYKKKGGLR